MSNRVNVIVKINLIPMVTVPFLIECTRFSQDKFIPIVTILCYKNRGLFLTQFFRCSDGGGYGEGVKDEAAGQLDEGFPLVYSYTAVIRSLSQTLR